MKSQASRLLIATGIAAGALCAGCSRELELSTSSPEALHAYQEAVTLYEKFYYREALEAINRAIAADSGFAMAWVRKGVIDAELKSREASQQELSRALTLAPGTTPPEQLVIRMWYHWITFDPPAAAAVADSLIELYPRIREAYLIRGRLYENEKKHDEAIALYLRAIEMDSTYAQAVMSLGYAYSNQGKMDRASAAMERYLRLRPDDADPPASYGDILLRVGRYEDALKQYRASLVLKPDYWYSFQRIGDIYTIQGRLQAAEEQYRKSLELLPQSDQSQVRGIILSGRLDLLRARYADAEKEFRSAMAKDSVSGDAAYGLTYVYAKTGRFKEADRLLEAIHEQLRVRKLTASPAMAGYHLIRAVKCTEQGEYADALAAAREALTASIPVNRVQIFNQIAEIYLRAGEYETALDACEEALAIAPNTPEVLLTLAKVYKKKGDVAMAGDLAARLRTTWKDADPDFYLLAELHKAIPEKGHRASPSRTSGTVVPSVASTVAASVIWSYLLQFDGGLFNQLLGLVGIGPVNWLGTPSSRHPRFRHARTLARRGVLHDSFPRRDAKHPDTPLRRRLNRRGDRLAIVQVGHPAIDAADHSFRNRDGDHLELAIVR